MPLRAPLGLHGVGEAECVQVLSQRRPGVVQLRCRDRRSREGLLLLTGFLLSNAEQRGLQVGERLLVPPLLYACRGSVIVQLGTAWLQTRTRDAGRCGLSRGAVERCV